MANEYVTVEEFAAMLGAYAGNLNEAFAEQSITSASDDVNAICGRRFYQETPVAREFDSVSPYKCWIDDCYVAPTVVAFDSAYDGTFATTLTASQYVLEPRNGIGPTGQAGWPYTTICAVGGFMFGPLYSPGYPLQRPTNLRVTATWGWAAVPSAVKSATLRLAHLHYEARNAPFGAAGTPDTGYIRIRDDQLARRLLEPTYVREPMLVA